jgi:hypothetical protein
LARAGIGFAESVIESEDEREEGHKRWAGAFHLFHDGPENGDADAQYKQQDCQQHGDCLSLEPGSSWRVLLGRPCLLFGGATVALDQRDGNISAFTRMGAAVLLGARLVGYHDKARQQQYHGDCMQWAVEGEARVDAGGEVTGS